MSDQRGRLNVHGKPETGSGTPVTTLARQRFSGQISYTYHPPLTSTAANVPTMPMMMPTSSATSVLRMARV